MVSANAIPFASGSDLDPPSHSLAIRGDEFTAWLEHAAPGARVEYHRGFLPLDRDLGSSPFGHRRRRELIEIAHRAAALAESGRVLLAQERHGFCDYSYFAIQPKRQPHDSRKPVNHGGR